MLKQSSLTLILAGIAFSSAIGALIFFFPDIVRISTVDDRKEIQSTTEAQQYGIAEFDPAPQTSGISNVLERNTSPQQEFQINYYSQFGQDGLDPQEWAEISYVSGWKSFVENLDLTEHDKKIVQEFIVSYWARFKELSDHIDDGEISIEEFLAIGLEAADLEKRLSIVLSPDQFYLYRLQNKALSNSPQHTRITTSQAYIEEDSVEMPTFSSFANQNAILEYIDSGADVNAIPDDSRVTLLHNAVFLNNLELTQTLIEAGADVNPPNAGNEYSPLQWAAIVGNLEIVGALVNSGADMDYGAGSSEFGLPALATAAAVGNHEVVMELISLGANVAGETGVEALRLAVTQGDLQLEQILIEAGADNNASEVVLAREFWEQFTVPR